MMNWVPVRFNFLALWSCALARAISAAGCTGVSFAFKGLLSSIGSSVSMDLMVKGSFEGIGESSIDSLLSCLLAIVVSFGLLGVSGSLIGSCVISLANFGSADVPKFIRL